MNKLKIIFLLTIVLITTGCTSSSDWHSSFVVWKGNIYETTDEIIHEVEEEIGQVTKYSDQEGTYSGNFSNTYKKGTKYFVIAGVDSNEAIAVDDDGIYRKAIRIGRYAKE